ncbi:MAG: hypothetical protein R3E79_08560 [Caldilineaceae bacterium]
MTPAEFAHVYWIGGSPCAGKSTVAQAVADRYQLHYYHCDAWFATHQRQADPAQQPTLHRLASLSCDERWLPPVADQVARVQAIYGEEFGMILADLRALPADQPILAEGAALLPAHVLPYLPTRRQAIWLTPTPTFQRTHYAQRSWIHDVLATCTDPAQAFQHWMARDEAYAAWIKEAATALGLAVVQVDGQQPVDAMIRQVAAWFGLVESAGRGLG